MRYIYLFIFAAIFMATAETAHAGNPDRQGEAGAYQLLMNPWARSTGLNSLVTARVQGVEAMRINVAGLGSVRQTEILFAHTRYLVGTDIGLNAFGLGQRIGKNGVLGLSLMAIDFGDIDVTTANSPEGTGATYSPGFFNMGVSYAHTFNNKIAVGATFRFISESASNVSASGIAIDAGVQYVTGPKDNIKFGISLRNVGTPMQYSGQGLSFSNQVSTSNGAPNFVSSADQRSASYELPSTLNIGGAYDFIINEQNTVTIVANFASNSFSRDEIGAGLEYRFNQMFAIRGGYKIEVGDLTNEESPTAHNGLSAGVSLDVPFRKGGASRVGLDYAYRTTDPFGGTHNIGIRLNL